MFWVIVFLVVVAIAATYVTIRMRDAARAEQALRRPPAPDDDQAFLREVHDKLLRDERLRDRDRNSDADPDPERGGEHNPDRGAERPDDGPA